VTAKIISALATIAITVGSAVVIFFFMLLAMNGFHESDATWGLGTYIVLALAITICSGIAAFSGVHLLAKRKFSGPVAAIISIGICSIAGVTAQLVSSAVGIAIADFVRRNY
jgi:hypothetical protein